MKKRVHCFQLKKNRIKNVNDQLKINFLLDNKLNIPSISVLHPVDTSHWSLLHLHNSWHLIPYVGNGHFWVQFFPLKPDIQTEIVIIWK